MRTNTSSFAVLCFLGAFIFCAPSVHAHGQLSYVKGKINGNQTGHTKRYLSREELKRVSRAMRKEAEFYGLNGSRTLTEDQKHQLDASLEAIQPYL